MAEWNSGTLDGSARREMLDYVIPLNEYHLRRLGRAYIAYYHAIALTFTEHAKRDREGLGHWIGQLEAGTHGNVLVVD